MTRKTLSSNTRFRKRSLVLVERETCETAGGMSVNLTAGDPGERTDSFPYADWGPWAALLGVLLALGSGIVIGIPAAILGYDDGELTTLGNVGVQLATALGFLLAPLAIATRFGTVKVREAISRLGLRRFKWSALGWMAATIGAYLLFAALYVALVVEPKQEDIAEGFGALPIQILLIAIVAPISEEVCFRGMLFGGLRERLPMLPAALAAGVVFGALHALTGITAVPPLIVFGFLLCLLYERTGSIVPCIILHMLNNSVALLGQ